MSSIRRVMQVFGSRSTKLVGIGWGSYFPFYYVTEYPKSGGTWLGKMLADYLEVSFPQRSIFPIGCASVIHNHWVYSPRLENVVYLMRDGRDLVVSSYFGCLRSLENDLDGSAKAFLGKKFAPFGAARTDLHDLERYLPDYIDSWVKNPIGSQYSWPDHVGQWLGKDNVIPIKYEDLLSDIGEVLPVLIAGMTGVDMVDLDEKKIATIINRHSFEKISGRKPGTENRSSFLRKGISGDWRNHFNREAADAFQAYCGDTLVELGYETSGSWVDDVCR